MCVNKICLPQIDTQLFSGGVSHSAAFVCPPMCVCVRTCSCPHVCMCVRAGVRAYPPVCVCTFLRSDRQLTGGEKAASVTEETDIDAEEGSQVPAVEESNGDRGVTDLDATANTTGLNHAESKVRYTHERVLFVFVRFDPPPSDGLSVLWPTGLKYPPGRCPAAAWVGGIYRPQG